jgi:membrane-associated protease RseP (regulator of RpoE activity)
MTHAIRPIGSLALALLLSAAGALLAAPPIPPKPPAPAEPPDVVTVFDHDGQIDVENDGPAILRVMAGPRTFIGVRLVELTPELREHFGAPREAGVMISAVEADGPGAKAGLKVGDIVTQADGKPLERAGDLSRAVRRKDDGEKISLQVTREKAVKTIEVTVAERRGARREVRIGERESPHAWRFSIPEIDRERFDAQMERLKKKLADLERKLKDLEHRLRTN